MFGRRYLIFSMALCVCVLGLRYQMGLLSQISLKNETGLPSASSSQNLPALTSMPLGLIRPRAARTPSKERRIDFHIQKGRFHPDRLQLQKCNKGNRRPLHPDMAEAFQFMTHVNTSLHILTMGDSIGFQFGMALQESFGVVPGVDDDGYGSSGGKNDRRRAATIPDNLFRPSIKREGGPQLFSVAQGRGGGIVAAWRITGMLLEEGRGKRLAPWSPNRRSYNGGWWPEDVEWLFNQTKVVRNHTGTGSDPISNFDVLVFRPPQGWISPSRVTNDTLYETVELAHRLFGVTHVIFVTGPLINNYRFLKEIEELEASNQRMRDFGRRWELGHLGVDRVDVLDFDLLTDEATEWNAGAVVKMNISSFTGKDDKETQNITIRKSYLEKRVGNSRWASSAAQACGNVPDPETGECAKNMLSQDGMHPCMETYGGRFTAGVACLLSCKEEQKEVQSLKSPLHTQLPIFSEKVDCELPLHASASSSCCVERCNQKYMRISSPLSAL